MVKFKVLCSEKGQGDLGLRDLTVQNKAFTKEMDLEICFGKGLHLEKVD